MQILKELIGIVGKQAIKRIEVMGNPTNYSSKMRALYDGIHHGKLETDIQAAESIYNEKPDSTNYKKLKYRLQKRLINSIFFIDTSKPSFSELQRAYYSCHKASAAVEILLGRAARTAAIDLARRTLNMASKFEFTDICFNMCKKLMRHHGTVDRDIKKFDHYNKLMKSYAELQQAELLAEEFFERLYLYISKSKSYSEAETTELAIQYSEELKKKFAHLDSTNLFLYSYYVHTTRYEQMKDQENLLKVQNEAIQYLESKRHANKRFMIVVLMRQLSLYTSLKEFEKGKAAAERCLELIGKQEYNWFSVQETYINLCLHTQNYQQAYDILCVVTGSKNYASLPNLHKEAIALLEAYINFLIKIGKIDTSLSEYTLKRFRVSKFLNEVPSFSMDKRGQNIPVLIIQLLFMLHQKKYDLVWDRVETLNAYCYRYLRKDHTFRSNCFIKMLLLLPKADFHKERVIRRAKPLFNRLQSVPVKIIAMEIIPYETLWEHIIELLENKIYTS